jgi:hypothetical protein
MKHQDCYFVRQMDVATPLLSLNNHHLDGGFQIRFGSVGLLKKVETD